MPRRATREFVLFHENDIAPAQPGQVVQKTTTGDTATYYDDSCF